MAGRQACVDAERLEQNDAEFTRWIATSAAARGRDWGKLNFALDIEIALCNCLRMNSETAPSSEPCTDPALAVAERQLVLLGELAERAMQVSRAYAAAATAAAEAEAKIVSEPWFTPEIGRARACGAKEASASFDKVTPRPAPDHDAAEDRRRDRARSAGGNRRAREGGIGP